MWETQLSHPQRRQKGCWSYSLSPSQPNLASSSAQEQSRWSFPTLQWNFFRALPERQVNKPSLPTQWQVAREIDPHGKHTSAEVTAVEARKPTIKNQVLKQREESKKHSFLFFSLSPTIKSLRLQANSFSLSENVFMFRVKLDHISVR